MGQFIAFIFILCVLAGIYNAFAKVFSEYPLGGILLTLALGFAYYAYIHIGRENRRI